MFSAFPSFTPHWEVWGLLLAIVLGGFYVARVIGPKVVEPGAAVVSRRQVTAFWLAIGSMTAASVWPLHDIAEQRLYSGHMFQHLVLTMVVPPLFLLSCPTWLAELLVASGGRMWRIVRVLATPILAFSLFNAFNLLSHWAVFVNLSVSNGIPLLQQRGEVGGQRPLPFGLRGRQHAGEAGMRPQLCHAPAHRGVHGVAVATALVMWLPICGPWPELRLSIPGQMVYLFAQSILPTLPAAWLWLAHTPVYSSYDQPVRLWGITVMDDQAAAGLIMKVLEAAYLWAIIAVLFFRWAARHQAADREGLYLTEREILEWEEGERGGLDGTVPESARAAASD